tara:strand:- start:5590 stop:6270 length:681 start_codon:yes stop_codon:yes gene_type:complete
MSQQTPWSRYRFLTAHAFRMEWREKHGLAGLFLFALASVYACYQVAGGRASSETWNALAWVVLMFSAFNAVAKPWPEDSDAMRRYLKTTLRPSEWILARMTFYAVVLSILSLLIFLSFTIFLGSEHFNAMQGLAFLLGLESTAIAFAALLSVLSAISSRAGAGFGLTAVLGLPLIIPIVLISTRYGTDILNGILWIDTAHHLLFLGALTGGIGTLGFILFPYLWRD